MTDYDESDLLLMRAVDCSTSNITGAYTYTVPSPATLGTLMPVSCNAGYDWDTPPYGTPQTAICKNNTGTGQWQINGGSTCVCMNYKLVPFLESFKLDGSQQF